MTDRPVGTGYARNSRFLHRFDRGNLVTHDADGFCARTNERKSGYFDALRKIGVFRQETITRMNSVNLVDLCQLYNFLDTQVGL